MTRIPHPVRRLVYERAEGRCEDCRLPERYTIKRHHIDHITAEKHGGATHENNLCLSCAACNRYKGSDLTTIDPETKHVVQLFNPRPDNWQEHFRLEGTAIQGTSIKGRATVRLLRMNEEDNLDERARLIKLGYYP